MVPIANGTVESIRPVAAQRGDGEAVLGPEALAMPVPAELVEPKAFRVETDRQRGVRSDLLVRVERMALEVNGYSPAVGDRVCTRHNRLGAAINHYEVSDTMELSAGIIVELTLAEREDAAGQTGGA